MYNAASPKLYCLPKIHKHGAPLRPIVSCVGAPFFELSTYVAAILGSAFDDYTNYNIGDSFCFVERYNGYRIPDNHVLVFFDVISLFTSIPSELVVNVLNQEWQRIELVTNIDRVTFFKIIQFLFDSSYFVYDDTYYQQIFGTPMGSPISPSLANLVMDYLLKSVVPTLPHKPGFIEKYVDDIILSLPSHAVDITLKEFNEFNPHIKFTVETEVNGEISFLDLLLSRQKTMN